MKLIFWLISILLIFNLFFGLPKINSCDEEGFKVITLKYKDKTKDVYIPEMMENFTTLKMQVKEVCPGIISLRYSPTGNINESDFFYWVTIYEDFSKVITVFESRVGEIRRRLALNYDENGCPYSVLIDEEMTNLMRECSNFDNT